MTTEKPQGGGAERAALVFSDRKTACLLIGISLGRPR